MAVPVCGRTTLTLTADALIVALSMRNLHHAPAPAGLGLHPQFARSGAPNLQFGAGAVWRNGADMPPMIREQVPNDWDHGAGLRIGTASLDNCFADWDGRAQIAWPSVTLTIMADSVFRHLIVYTPPGRDFFSVEPVSHMNDAINRMATTAGHGLRVLSPGDTLQGEVTFRITHIG